MKRGRSSSKSGKSPAEASIKTTITALRKCNVAQARVIDKLEGYQRAIAGVGFSDDRERSGYRNGYELEVEYLRWRGNALDELIESFEVYRRVAEDSAGIADFLTSD